MPRQNTTRRAYVLSDRSGYQELCDVVFALTAREARRTGYLDNVSWIDLAVRRAPEFDEYASTDELIPIAAMLARGWFWECSGCCLNVRTDDPGVIIDEKERDVFCSESCQALLLGRDAGRDFADEEQIAVKKEAERRFGEENFAGVWWDHDEHRYYARVRILPATETAPPRYGNWWEGDAAVTPDPPFCHGCFKFKTNCACPCADCGNRQCTCAADRAEIGQQI